MKFVTAVGLLMVMAVPLMGAKCSGNAEGRMDCTSQPGSGCTKSVKVTGAWEFDLKSQGRSSLAALDAQGATFDAALWTIDLSGSNVTMPTYGTALLKLVDSSNAQVLASRNFGWVRSGQSVRLSNPDAVNSWAADNAGTADTLIYETAPFLTSENVGANNLVMTDRYDNEQLAYSRFSWRSEERCPKRLDRHGNQIIYCP